MRYRYFLLIGGFFISSMLTARSNDSLFMRAAIQKMQHSKDYTLKVARLMPAENYAFKPDKEEMSFGQQLLHLSANMGWLCSSYLEGGKNPVNKEDEKLQTKEAIQRVLNKAYDFALLALQQFDEAHLGDPVTFFAGPMNKLQIINLLSDHQTHHRAQILVYLRLNGIKPPDYVGW